jgi:Bardet-Biedl syndrome 7 protein
MKARTTEGEYGELTVIVTARTTPRTSQRISFQVKPLSLHHRLHASEFTPEMENRPKNILKFTGSFTLSMMHEWVSFCLPDVPARMQEESVTFHFQNVFLRSLLVCQYERGEAIFSSDSVSTIAILKEVISREATNRRVSLSDSVQIIDETIPAFLEMVHPKLDAMLAVVQQVELLEAVKEIRMQEADASWMSPEYQYVLDNADQIRAQFKERPRALEFIAGIVTDLFVDFHKFRGHNAKHKIPELQQLLSNYCYEDVLAFFDQAHV